MNLVLDQDLLERSTPIGVNELPRMFAHRLPADLPIACVREVHLYGLPSKSCRLYPVVEHPEQAVVLEKRNLSVHSLMADGDGCLFTFVRKDADRLGQILLEVVTDPGQRNVFLLVHC